ncbi:MAG TPA: hypothetical protein VGF67_29130 [Ktedonobacteraceae bacterium]
MSLSPLELAWLAVACGCIVVGTWLTYRRWTHSHPRPAPPPRRCHCGQLPGARDRFCGRCGRRIASGVRETHTSLRA